MASVGDLMSAVLFVFIITVVVFSQRLAQTQADVKAKVDGMKAARAEVLRELKERLSNASINVEVDEQRGILRLPEKLVFQQGSAVLGLQEKAKVDTLARVLAEVLPPYTDSGNKPIKLEAIFIEGHTDSIPINNSRFRDNIELSTARAREVFLEITSARPSLGEVRNRDGQYLFSTSGYAERRPCASNATPDGRARNRRIDLRIVMASPSADSTVASYPDSVSLSEGGL
jgi:chemotaxis protein MotB